MIGLTGSPLDRADMVRGDDAALARLARDGAARLLVLDGVDPVMSADGGLSWIAMDDRPTAALIFLGLREGAARFAAIAEGSAVARSPELMAAISVMRRTDAAIYATARSMIGWHAANGWCARCGAPMRPIRGGWARRCEAGHETFPRTDPVVIMLAEHDARVLVGRQPAFPPRRYSALAGFVEPGESIEEAVARELAEEAGVVATSVRYVASQPWPFPSSLMIGCIADVADDRITVDGVEIEHAMWVGRDEVRAALAGAAGAPFEAPPPIAIAHSLLAIWAEDVADQ